MSTPVIDSPVPSSRPPQARPPRVLYAEDVPDLREVMSLILQHAGYAIETAADGAAALRRLRQAGPAFDLVMTDHHMPGMNGLELVRCLRGGDFAGPIVVFSSELDPGVHAAYHRLGVQLILPKPIRPDRLREALAGLLPAGR